jgi:pimeloyl-ACP methyl ester carboxylesterase
MEEIAILNHGARLNGLVYLSSSAGPHPVVIFLHGYPGNERNLDLAQAARRAGYQAVFIDYRGNWGSGGTFSFAKALDDVRATLAWVRAPENAAKYHFNPARIALVGHSFGGWLALMTAGAEPPNLCVAAMAAWNIGWDASRFDAHPNEEAENLSYLRVTTDKAGGPIRADADELLKGMKEHAAAWDYLGQAAGFKTRPLLLVAATRDTPDEGPAMHAQFATAVRAAGGKLVRRLTFNDDHQFSSHRVELAGQLIRWLKTDCARAQDTK